MGFRVRLKLLGELATSREVFFENLWASCEGVTGVHEGTVLSNHPHSPDRWTVDAGAVPPERDWIREQAEPEIEIYFESERNISNLKRFLEHYAEKNYAWLTAEKVEEQDWDAEWKASFKGVDLPPFWKIAPPWLPAEKEANGVTILRINPGAGFGTGTHETTQLCLMALGESARQKNLSEISVLDFGSGSGILSIAAALKGAEVDSVEIDEMAIENGRQNAQLNGIENKIKFFLGSADLESQKKYEIILANILKHTLLEFCEFLVKKWKGSDQIILSGLLKTDVATVKEKYYQELKNVFPGIEFGCNELTQGDWHALVFLRK